MRKLGKALRNGLSSRMGIKSKSLIDPLKIKGSFLFFAITAKHFMLMCTGKNIYYSVSRLYKSPF